jgi:hypothetical protein
MYIPIITPLKNYTFVKECFQILVDDRIGTLYGLKLKNGVMYTAIGFDKDVPPDYIPTVIKNQLAALEEGLQAMNTDGLFKVELEDLKLPPDEKSRVYYRILFKPIFPLGSVILAVVLFLAMATGITYGLLSLVNI